MSGKGVETYTNTGEKYDGEYMKGHKHGKGTFYYSNGT